MPDIDRYLFEAAQTDAKAMREVFDSRIDDLLDDLVEFGLISITSANSIRSIFEWEHGHSWEPGADYDLVCKCGAAAAADEAEDGPCYLYEARLARARESSVSS